MKSKLIILGCGSSVGVPRIDGFWGNCKKNEKKNNRTRCSAIIIKGSNRILIDTSPDLKVLIHCFTGSKEFAKKLLDINCYISVSGIITFKNSTELVDTVSSIPIERLLVETDSPYLAPLPYRGKSNEPSYIIHTVEKLSQIKKISKEKVITNTTNNFRKLFDIS